MTYYPAFINLKNRKAVVIGGGPVAERKIFSLLKAGADVTVISPQVTNRILAGVSSKRITHVSRPYKKNDLRGAFLVIAATDSPGINSRVARDAPGLVNVVDVPSQCNFIAPSVIQRGALTIAISTSGTSPALAKAIRRELQKLYGREIGEFLRFLKGIRKKVLSHIADGRKRETFLKNLASDKMLNDLRTQGLEAVKLSVCERYKRLTR